MKKHFLLLALAAICSLGVFGQTVTAGWDGYSKNNLPSNGNAVDNTITLSTNLSTGGYSLGGRSTNAYNYEYANSDNYIDITTPDNMEITSVTAYITYLGDNNSIAIQFCSESPFSSADLGSETLTGSTIQDQESPCSPTIPSGTRSARIHRANTGWGPYLYAVSVTAEPAAAPVGPVDPITKFDNGTYYIGSTGLDLSSLLTTKNKDGAVTYTVKNANGTGATITGSTFTATTAGTATVTAYQEAVPDKYNAQSVDATITVKKRDYATSANFYDLATSYGSGTNGVKAELDAHHYTVSNLSDGVEWDAHATVLGDHGLKFGGYGYNEFSFWVPANQSVTIQMGYVNNNGGTGTTKLYINDVESTSFVVGTNEYQRGPVNDPYITTVETQFKIVFTSPYWSLIQNITISDMSPKTVSFNTQGGTPETIDPIAETSYGLGITLPSVTKSGYIFDGWYTAATGGTFAGNAGANYKPADNCTLHAHWAKYAKSIDFMQKDTQDVVVATVLSRNNYTMSPMGNTQWDNGGGNYSGEDCGLKSEDGDRDFSFWVKAYSNVTITLGTWKGNATTHTADLYANDVKIATLQQKTANGPYTTDGDTKFTIKIVNPYWSLIQKIDIEAIKYTITFNPGENGTWKTTAPTEPNHAYGDKFNLPKGDVVVRDGYHFTNWSDGTNTYAAEAPYTMPASDVTFTAIWEEDSDVEYTVEYANGGGTWTGTAPTEGNHKAGETFALPASSEVTRDGYQFAGWNDGTTTFAAEATYTMPAKAVTLTATWNQLYNVTYVKGEVDYTGDLPTQKPQIAGASFKVAAGIKCQGYAFKGWKAGVTTYQPNDDFTMPAAAVEFVAQWEAVTVPTITDLAITEPVNEIVPLSWNIPGLVDMSKHTIPNPQINNSASSLYGEASDTKSHELTSDGVEVKCQVAQYENDGVAFPIPASNVEWVDFDYFISSRSSNVSLLGGVCTDNDFYWDLENKLTQDNTWTNHRSPITHKCWDANKDASSFNQVAIMANAGSGGGNVTFSVRNVRYHTTGMSDVEIAKVTLVRKAGEASTSPADGDVLINQQVAFDFTDTQAKEPGKYYYTVFAYDAEGNYSAAVTEEYELVVKQTYTVTYAAGGEDVIGEVPVDEMPKVDGTKFNLLAPGSLLKPYCQFNGWKSSDDGKVYAAGQEYTMPAKNVTFTAQWQEHSAMVIPLDAAVLDCSNATNSVNKEQCDWLDNSRQSINLSSEHATAQWEAYIYPAKYEINCLCGVTMYGIGLKISLIDPASGQEIITKEVKIARPGQNTQYTTTITDTWDLSALQEGKYYVIQVQEYWNDGTCQLKVAYVNFQVQPTVNILLKDNDEDNNVQRLINAFENVEANISLQRTLSSASLNTLCLPFSLSAEDLMAEELYAFTGAAVSQSGDGETLLTLQFEDADEIEAGVPYLIRPSEDVVNPTFNHVTITATEPQAVGDENVLFRGIYVPTTLVANDENNLFVGANSTLFWPDEDATMPGLRAYFQILTPAAQVATRAQMKFNQHVITDLNIVRPARAEHYKYIDRNGRLIIVRDGKAYGILGSHLAR